jgi:hypothetical protein
MSNMKRERYHFIDLSPRGTAGYHLAKLAVQQLTWRKLGLHLTRRKERKAA